MQCLPHLSLIGMSCFSCDREEIQNLKKFKMSLSWKYSTTSLVAGSPKIRDRNNLLKTKLDSIKEPCSNAAHHFKFF